MRPLSDALASNSFVITCELNPPKGVDLEPLFEKAETLRDRVDAINLTDSAGSNMTMGNIAAASLLRARGVETILQVTCRDRNRLALQGELLAAHALGISNVLCMTGDPPSGGDHPDAKPVFDLGAVSLLRAAQSLNLGADLASHELKGAPSLHAGAVVNPGAGDMDTEMRRMEEKIDAGARFFQSQAVYEPALFEQFMNRAVRSGVPIMAGIILLKSSRMAQRLNKSLPGVHVPDALIQEMEDAHDSAAKSVEMAARIIRQIRGMCSGVHIMAIGWESRIPQVLDAAGLGAADGAQGIGLDSRATPPEGHR